MGRIGGLRIEEFEYPLPVERIARYPVSRRDDSRLLVYRRGEIGESLFRCLPDWLPAGSLLVFNNTRVIEARLVFGKPSGGSIEIFCLEPVSPRDYAVNFQQTGCCRWNCMVGNLRKWKGGLLERRVVVGGRSFVLTAERKGTVGDTHWVDFRWDGRGVTFAEILSGVGILPIPPYLHRETEASDMQTYQTVYSSVNGSVAAPTAGLHFTPELLGALDGKGFCRSELTLHVGAGTFRPVKSASLVGHVMHAERFAVSRCLIERLLSQEGGVIAVGTTTLRALESLYYLGALVTARPQIDAAQLTVPQWASCAGSENLSPRDALQNLLGYLERRGEDQLIASTQLFLLPGHRFKYVSGLITNFHQPRSTLLVLVAAFVGSDWRRIYHYALSRSFRFLSYGDASLLIP